jgi:hypothetical protein
VIKGKPTEERQERKAVGRLELVTKPASPSRETAEDELRRALRRMPAGERLSNLLMHAGSVAANQGLASLTRVLTALEVASDEGDLTWLDAKHGPVASARAFLAKRGRSGVAPSRPDLARWLARHAPPANRDLHDPIVLHEAVSLAMLALVAKRAELVIGPAIGTDDDVRARLGDELRALARGSQRSPLHYVRAVLRGWGLSAAEAKDVAPNRLKL